MQTILYEGRIRKISESKVHLDGLDICCDFVEIVTTYTMGTAHEQQDNNYITLAVTRNKFKIGDFVSLRLVKEENLT